MRTQFGEIAQLPRDAGARRTPSRHRLASFGRKLIVMALIICTIVLTTGPMRGEATLPMFLTALSLAIAAMPESLPAVATIALGPPTKGVPEAICRHALPKVSKHLQRREHGWRSAWVSNDLDRGS